jgi:hypothetical protein
MEVDDGSEGVNRCRGFHWRHTAVRYNACLTRYEAKAWTWLHLGLHEAGAHPSLLVALPLCGSTAVGKPNPVQLIHELAVGRQRSPR